MALGVGAGVYEVCNDTNRHEGSSAVRVQRRADISTASVSVIIVLPADSRSGCCSGGGYGKKLNNFVAKYFESLILLVAAAVVASPSAGISYENIKVARAGVKLRINLPAAAVVVAAAAGIIKSSNAENHRKLQKLPAAVVAMLAKIEVHSAIGTTVRVVHLRVLVLFLLLSMTPYPQTNKSSPT